MKIIQQDMLTLTQGILFHQVNCQGIMGGGIAASFARKWPQLEEAYKVFVGDGTDLLGKVWVWNAAPGLKIANVFGQDDISRSERMTSYDATCEAFDRIVRSIKRNPKSSFWSGQFYFPYGMGCGLGGGNWKIYSAIIEAYFPDAIICKHE